MLRRRCDASLPISARVIFNVCEKETMHIKTNDLEKLGREIGALNP